MLLAKIAIVPGILIGLMIDIRLKRSRKRRKILQRSQQRERASAVLLEEKSVREMRPKRGKVANRTEEIPESMRDWPQ